VIDVRNTTQSRSWNYSCP